VVKGKSAPAQLSARLDFEAHAATAGMGVLKRIKVVGIGIEGHAVKSGEGTYMLDMTGKNEGEGGEPG
jgi:hypothetical protein